MTWTNLDRERAQQEGLPIHCPHCGHLLEVIGLRVPGVIKDVIQPVWACQTHGHFYTAINHTEPGHSDQRFVFGTMPEEQARRITGALKWLETVKKRAANSDQIFVDFQKE